MVHGFQHAMELMTPEGRCKPCPAIASSKIRVLQSAKIGDSTINKWDSITKRARNINRWIPGFHMFREPHILSIPRGCR